MKLLPITNNNCNQNNVKFKSKYSVFDKKINAKIIREKLDTLHESDENTKRLFSNLLAFSGFISAELALLSKSDSEIKQKINDFLNRLNLEDVSEIKDDFVNYITKESDNESKEKVDYSPILSEKQERNNYLVILTKYFPELSLKYEEMLKKSLNEPDNKENKQTLETLEKIFEIIFKDNGLKYRKRYLEALDKDYIDCLDGVCKNFDSTVANGESPMRYLTTLANGRITPEEIEKWTKVPDIDFNQYMILRNMDKETLINFAKLKRKDNRVNIKTLSPMASKMTKIKTYAFRVDFPYIPLTEKLKMVESIHEAMYGGNVLRINKDENTVFEQKDVQTEMISNIIKDKHMYAVYYLVRYLNPDAISSLNIHPDEIKTLDKNDERYIKLKQICTSEIVHMDFESPKVKVLMKVLKDDELYKGVMTTRHARMRFISRFVLRDNPNEENLEKEATKKVKTLIKELHNKISICNFFCYIHTKGLAPQFYLKDSTLGNYVKITLNSEGTINTIYEDINKEPFDQNFADEQDNE